MKTLRNILDEHSTTIHRDHVPSIIGEWLTQKRQTLHPDPTNYIFKTDILTIQAFIDVLLEELNHE